MRQLLRNYLSQRLQFYNTRDLQLLRQIDVDTAQMQNELWSAVQARAVAQPTPMVALAVSGMNDVLNSQGYTQAAGHVPFGVTDFTLTHTGSLASGTAVPNGVVTHVRVDVAAGLATAPAAVAQCTMAEFGETEVLPGFYLAPACKEGGGALAAAKTLASARIPDRFS